MSNIGGFDEAYLLELNIERYRAILSRPENPGSQIDTVRKLLAEAEHRLADLTPSSTGLFPQSLDGSPP